MLAPVPERLAMDKLERIGELFVECAPWGGRIEQLELTTPAGLPEDGSHDEASIAQRSVQATGC
jgi:hypothetical protein